MQDINLVCTLNGAEYKEYEVLMNEKSLGVISWKSESEPSSSCWYTTASDGNSRYFQTQEEVVQFLIKNPLKSANDLSAKLKAEANKIIAIANEIENKNEEPED